MNRACDSIDTASPVCIESHTDIEVRHRIESCEPVEQVPAFYSVHTAEDDVALGNVHNGFLTDEICPLWEHLLSESHAGNGRGEGMHFWAPKIGIFLSGIQDAVQVLFFHQVRVNQHESAD